MVRKIEIECSGPVMIIDALVVFQSTLDLPSLPSTLVIENISKVVEIALIEFNTTVSTVGDVRFASEVGVDFTCRRVVVSNS